MAIEGIIFLVGYFMGFVLGTLIVKEKYKK